MHNLYTSCIIWIFPLATLVASAYTLSLVCFVPAFRLAFCWHPAHRLPSRSRPFRSALSLSSSFSSTLFRRRRLAAFLSSRHRLDYYNQKRNRRRRESHYPNSYWKSPHCRSGAFEVTSQSSKKSPAPPCRMVNSATHYNKNAEVAIDVVVVLACACVCVYLLITLHHLIYGGYLRVCVWSVYEK